ncbi:MAG: hypothetical protein QG669_480 [Patescibacteria group bacterium]|jgi:SAM-dependent methyltransferase|nr:hypothetical protein [Patescibacteria group bacterium]
MHTTKESMYGNFGVQAENYNKHRPPYEDAVFTHICNENNWKWKDGQTYFRFLDLGCGTGISTASLLRQIQLRLPKNSTFELIGLDKDEHMISVAKQMVNDKRVKFIVGEITDDKVGRNFDLILCASAFHWICKDEQSIRKIRSLLHGGLLGSGGRSPFVVVNRELASPDGFRKYQRRIVESFSKEIIPDIKENYQPINILLDYEFTLVSSIVLRVETKVTVEAFENSAKTVSAWGMIEDDKKPKAESKLRDYINIFSKDGVIEKADRYKIVFGYRYNNFPETDIENN